MQVVILCGGQGTRLREETEYRPKPMVEIGGVPIVMHIMKIYAHFGYRDFILCLGYRGKIIKEYFLNYEAMNRDFTLTLGREHQIEYHGEHEEQNFRVTLVDTGEKTMTGGRVRRIERYITGDHFMVTYGDGVANVDVRGLVDFHQRHGRLATLTAVQPISRFGGVSIGPQSEVASFIEKPQLDGSISAGFFVFHREVFRYLDGGDNQILEQGPLERLASDGQLMAWPHRGFFFAMDTYRDYLALNEMWDRGDVPWKVW